MELAARLPVEEWLQESPQLAQKDIWMAKDLCELWQQNSNQFLSPEQMGHHLKHLKGSHKFEHVIKVAGKAGRLIAIRNGELWIERHSSEGNAALTKEYLSTESKF